MMRNIKQRHQAKQRLDADVVPNTKKGVGGKISDTKACLTLVHNPHILLPYIVQFIYLSCAVYSFCKRSIINCILILREKEKSVSRGEGFNLWPKGVTGHSENQNSSNSSIINDLIFQLLFQDFNVKLAA